MGSGFSRILCPSSRMLGRATAGRRLAAGEEVGGPQFSSRFARRACVAQALEPPKGEPAKWVGQRKAPGH